MPHTDEAIKGYTEQSSEIIGLVNRNKVVEEQVLRILDSIRNLGTDIDQRWLAVGRTHIEQGFMAVNRSLFQPSRLVLDSDEDPTYVKGT